MKKRILSLMLAAVTAAGCFGMTGCSSKDDSADGITKVSWYIPTVLEGKDVETVLNKANELLAERYNLELDLVCIDSGNYAQKMQVMNAGREVYDIAFTSNWTNDFASGVENGVYYDLSKDLPEVAPTVWANMSDAEKQAVSVDGAIYAIPNWQIQAKSTSLTFDKDKLDKSGMTLDEINTLDDVTTYLKKLHEVEPNCNVVAKTIWPSLTFHYGLNELIGEGLPPAIYFEKDGKPVVINQYETEEFENYVKTRDVWVKEGLVTDQYDPELKPSKKEIRRSPFGMHIYKPGLAADSTRSNGYEVVAKPFSKAVISSVGINAALTAVSATSEHPREALKMIEVMNSDKEIYNLLCWGLEGTHYTKVSDNKIETIDNSGYNRISNWLLGSIRNSYQIATAEDTLIQDTEDYNNNAVVMPLNGLTFSLANIATEIANCKTVVNEQRDMLELGLTGDVDAALAKFRADIKASGVDTMIKDLQAQVDEWWAANKQ